MTRALYGTMAADIAAESLTFCHCWQIIMTSGDVLRLTDHDEDLPFLGQTFSSDSGFNLSMLETGENLAVDNGELQVLLATNVVDKADIINGYYDGARVKVYLVNWSNPANYCALPGGFLSKINESDVGAATFELVGLASRLNQQTGSVLTPLCDADVGDDRCSLNMSPYTHSGTVTSVTSRSSFVDSSRAEPDEYFSYGKLTWTSGNNAGVVCEVRYFDSGSFLLMDPMKAAIQVGDGFSAKRGCDRRHATCKSLNNVENFRGFPFGPTNLEVMGGPT